MIPTHSLVGTGAEHFHAGRVRLNPIPNSNGTTTRNTAAIFGAITRRIGTEEPRASPLASLQRCLCRLAPVVDDVYVWSIVALFVRALHGDAVSGRGEAVLAHQAVGFDPGKVSTADQCTQATFARQRFTGSQ